MIYFYDFQVSNPQRFGFQTKEALKANFCIHFVLGIINIYLK